MIRGINEQDVEGRGYPNFVKYPRIPYVEDCKDLFGREVYVFEKIDGSLSQVMRTGSGILAGSKANFIKGDTRRPKWSQDFLKWMHTNPSLYHLKPGLIMYGEWLEPVTLDYDEDRLHKFYFIDLAVIEEGKPRFFDYNESLGYLEEWEIKGVEILPIIDKVFLNENIAMEIVNKNNSQLRSGEMEGIVLKNYNLQKYVKFLHPKHTEIRKQEQTLDRQYITSTRVDKAVRRLSDKGETVNLDSLVKEVRFDISEESGIDFEFDAIRGSIRARDLYNSND